MKDVLFLKEFSISSFSILIFIGFILRILFERSE